MYNELSYTKGISMKFASLVCIVFLLYFHELTAQVSGTPIPSSTPTVTDSLVTKKSSAPIEATLHTGMSAGILFGYGFKSGYDFGAGVRVGYTSSRLYLGGIFMYHFGRALVVNTGSLVTSTELFGYSAAGEIGYDILLEKKAVLRPMLGVGLSNFKGSSAISGKLANGQAVNEATSDNTTNLLISPGLLVQFPISHDLLFGGDLRYSVVTGDGDHSAFGLYTTFMFRF